ncbi:MAG: sulfotransferase family protein [Chloroflexota bacterium]
MIVFGAGLGRTGTTSIQRALSQLSLPTYNFESMVNEDHFEHWEKAFQTPAEADWEVIFADYKATVAWPTCFFYRELMVAYPHAKFILTTRDVEGWVASMLRVWPILSNILKMRFVPRIRKMNRLMNSGFQRTAFPYGMEQAGLIKAFNEHNEAVKHHIPANRLLIYEATEGWEPLCTFLNLDVPDVPFPHENRGEDFKKMASRVLGIGIS